LALVVLSVVEQRLDAVRAVLAGATVVEVAAAVEVSRSTLHRWIGRYLAGNVAGLADRSHRPLSCSHQAAAQVEVLVAELRRKHPRWGSKRIRMQLLRAPIEGMLLASERTINRILLRHGLALPRPRKRPRESFVRFERPGPMQLWQVDIVGGLWLVNPATGELREAKIVTGVDDHSRYCVMAKVVERATSRAVCVAFAEALARFGVPEEVQSDNGKQFTDRFGKGGEVMFDRICRKNGIKHRLTDPFSPNQNGKVERFHGTLRPDFLDQAEPFESVALAQALDVWVVDYNQDRPHQALDPTLPVTPAERFAPVPEEQPQLVELWLPPALETVPTPLASMAATIEPARTEWSGGPVEFDQVVPPSGNMSMAGRQFWLGPARAGLTVRFWASTEVIHLSIGGARVKSVASHLTVADLRNLVAGGAANAGAPPIPTLTPGEAVEVDRVISPGGTFTLGGQVLVGRRSWPAGRSVSVSSRAPCCCSTCRPGRCCAPGPTRCLPRRSCGCAEHVPPARHPGQRKSRSGCSGSPITPVSSRSAANASGWVVPTPGEPSRSWSPTPPWPASSATATATSSAAPPPSPPLRSRPDRRGRSPQFPRPSVADHLA